MYASKISALVADMRAMLDAAAAGGRDLSAEEIVSFDSKKAEVATLQAAAKRAEDLAVIEAGLSAVRPAVAQRVLPGAPKGPEAKLEFESVAEFMHAVVMNKDDQRLASLYAEQRMDQGAKGGFAVPKQFRDTMFAVPPQQAIFRPRATVLPAGSPPDAEIELTAVDQRTGTNASPSNVYGGVTVTKTAEGGAKPETDADLRLIKLKPEELFAHITATDKLLRNWQAAGAFFETQLRNAMIAAEDFEFLRGNGVGGPLGLLNSGAAYVQTRDTASQFNFADYAAMLSRIIMRGGSPVWILSRGVHAELLTMRNDITSPAVGGGDGALVFQPSTVPGQPSTLGGYPIIWNERSPGLGSTGDVVLADLSYYLVKDGSGPFVAASEHVYFLNNKTVIKLFWNVDGQPWLTEPFRGEDNYEVSPFVVLGQPS